MLIFILAMPVLEVILLYQTGLAFGFVNLIFFLILKGMVGKLIMRRASVLGQNPRPEHMLTVMTSGLGGLLISLPVLFTSLLGLLLLLPPTRWLLTKLFKNLFSRLAQSGNFKVFSSRNFTGFNHMGQEDAFSRQKPQSPFVNPDEKFSFERDVSPKIIDVRPIRVKDKKDSE